MMKNTFETYDSYKYSGVEWFKKMPKDWEVKRVKEIGLVVLGKMLDNMPREYTYYRSYLKSKNIGWLKVNDANIEKMYFSLGEMSTYRLKNGDILLSEGGEVGKTAFWNEEIEECYIQNSVHKITVNKNNYSKYFLYQSFLLGTIKYYDSIVNYVSIKHLTKEKLSRVIWFCPPLPEQKAIADYLDVETAQIDRKIDLLTQKATKYGELKQSRITETVTRGLDKTVVMKDSGVEWIGEVPEHWKVMRGKDVFEQTKNKAGLESSFYDVLSLTLKGVIKRDLDNMKGKIPASFDGYQITKPDDLVLCLFDMDVTPRIVGYIKQVGIITSAYTVIRAKYEAHMKYFLYYYLEQNRNGSLLANSKTLRSTMTFDLFSQLKLPVPPFPEQQSIADYLDNKTEHIDRIIDTINTQIDKLKELRKTLINDVVTGKIKVYQEGEAV
ncbi:MAG: restriction endonuclease subunit S [Bacillota bacterium]|nr:restriction endonuclease subunit S [Bacillota bacterium]